LSAAVCFCRQRLVFVGSGFRTALDGDNATWTRDRGWALAAGLNAYTSYAASNAALQRNHPRDHRRTQRIAAASPGRRNTTGPLTGWGVAAEQR